MNGLKQALKRLAAHLPHSVRNWLANVFHLVEAIIANIRFGFPSRGMHIVMVTGTNGKTTTVAFVAGVLKAAGYKTGVLGTAYFEVGDDRRDNDLNATVVHPNQVQAMLKEMKLAGVTHAVIEVTSHALQQHRLWGIKPNVAVMTNLTQDHLDYHGTMERYAAAKAKLFRMRPRFIVLNRDDDWFDYYNKFSATEQKITYGSDEQADCRIAHAHMGKTGSDVDVTIDHQTKLRFSVALPGKFNVYNAAAAAATGYVMHVPIDSISHGIASVSAVPGRQEKIDVTKPFDVIVDYAHTPDALEKLLESQRMLTKGRLILVFGATGDRDRSKRPIMGEIAAKLADRIIVTDEESYNEDPAGIRSMIMQGITAAKGSAMTDEIADRREAIAKAMSIARRGDTVVITGMGHEKYRIENGKRIPWNDGDVVRELATKPGMTKH